MLKQNNMKLPQCPNRVPADQRIGCQDGQSLFDSLADQHPVERIFVDVRQIGKVQRIRLGKLKRIDQVTLALPGNKLVWRQGQGKFPQLIFDIDLPDGNDAETDFIFRFAECGPHRVGQTLFTLHDPQERAGVQQQLQYFSP